MVKLMLIHIYLQLFQVNFSAATQRKKEELHSRQAQLEKEREMLKSSKTEWVWKEAMNEVVHSEDVEQTKQLWTRW